MRHGVLAVCLLSTTPALVRAEMMVHHCLDEAVMQQLLFLKLTRGSTVARQQFSTYMTAGVCKTYRDAHSVVPARELENYVPVGRVGNQIFGYVYTERYEVPGYVPVITFINDTEI